MPSHYAMLEDKIAFQQKRSQIFGTQIIVTGKKNKADVWPLINPDSVDIRRKSISMYETMEMYLARFDIKWDIEKYKKELPKLKEKYGIKD